MIAATVSQHRRGAFTLIEVTISVVIVGVLFAASMQTLAAAKAGQYQIAERTRGNELARALMSEIMQQAYADPGSSPVFGPEANQVRASYDDVDDYHGLAESPPVMKDGTAISVPAPTTWTRKVTVAYVNPLTLAGGASSETGAKMITVTVLHRSRIVATIRAVRTIAP